MSTLRVGTKVIRQVDKRKALKKNFMKKFMLEQQQIFGPLHETKKEKIRRLNLEKKGLVSECKSRANAEVVKQDRNDITSSDNMIKISSFYFKRLTLKPNAVKTVNNVPVESITDKNRNLIIKKEYGTIEKEVFPPEQFLEQGIKISKSVKSLNNQNNRSQSALQASIATTIDQKIQKLCSDKNISKSFNEREEVLRNIKVTKIFDKEPQKPHNVFKGNEILSIKYSPDNVFVPYVTSILHTTMSEAEKLVLKNWTDNMIKKMGKENFMIYKQELFDSGHLFHATVANILQNQPYDLPDSLLAPIFSVKDILKEVTEVKAVESLVYHPTLHYKGILDCAAVYKDKLCLIEWKLAEKEKKTLKMTYDAPLQLAAYIGALNADQKYPFEIRTGAIVVANRTGKPSTIFHLDEHKLQSLWKEWLFRLQKYYENG